ncbi:MAG: HEAT repeat domain-containing protein [Proteobacteria bacterium]|nr:HEAT repeat domain-containing protein [Pseudomonadota bacterium]NDF01057.1 HEAT repeat domain-containing protein [Verrucomicrobiota bacterium]
MPTLHARYEEIPEWSHEKVEQALRDDDPGVLRYAVVAISMHDGDWRYAQDLCVRLSSHPHFNVRGNAVLGFGHIARVHRQLDRAVVQPIIEAALRDADKYVRGHGVDTVADTEHFLGWKYDQKNAA